MLALYKRRTAVRVKLRGEPDFASFTTNTLIFAHFKAFSLLLDKNKCFENMVRPNPCNIIQNKKGASRK